MSSQVFLKAKLSVNFVGQRSPPPEAIQKNLSSHLKGKHPKEQPHSSASHKVLKPKQLSLTNTEQSNQNTERAGNDGKSWLRRSHSIELMLWWRSKLWIMWDWSNDAHVNVMSYVILWLFCHLLSADYNLKLKLWKCSERLFSLKCSQSENVRIWKVHFGVVYILICLFKV